jgi:hypothetical protein
MDIWTHKGKRYRLCRIARYEWDPLAAPDEPPDKVWYNVIQTRLFWPLPWTTLRMEQIPPHVVMTYSCFGDYGEWRSRLFEVAINEFGMPSTSRS